MGSSGRGDSGASQSMNPSPIAARVARELSLSADRVAAALSLFEGGATLPFIARYRKERTGGLDEKQLRDVRDRARYVAELEARRETIRTSIEEGGSLTPELAARIAAAETKRELEDLYLPYRPKRRTRATIARERGLEPLADRIWRGELNDAGARQEAGRHTGPEVEDADAALQGARDILAERTAEDADLRGRARRAMRERGTLAARAARGKKDLPEAQRFRDYFDHREPVRKLASHRVLAIRRGEAEGVLKWGIEAPAEVPREIESRITARGPAKQQLRQIAADAWKRLIQPTIETEIKAELCEDADEEAIRIFGENLENLLLQPPAGERPVLGLDPGFRTGVKAAAVSGTGAVLETAVLYLHREDGFRSELKRLVDAHRPELVAVGNGTAARETEQAVREALADGPDAPAVVMVNEAGASVYSASELAGSELPDLDVSLRGAVSIARRLQDPLAELVKIDPRSIGVGQYQHDVDQSRLKGRLDEVVERCVNRVGVELNTASSPLLSYVAGIGPALAARIVELRDSRGGLRARRELLDVPGLGPKTFEQAAGFLRIRGGEHPLDASAVHPERYELVARMAADSGVDVAGLVENEAILSKLEPALERYIGPEVGLPTLRDILEELRRPGRDPRERFEPPAFRDDVREPSDLEPGMELQGVVTNVVAFGAFIDVGVHQDGLVHISQLADRFVKDPNQVVKVGQRVKVRVLNVDLERGRIGLTMKRPA